MKKYPDEPTFNIRELQIEIVWKALNSYKNSTFKHNSKQIL